MTFAFGYCLSIFLIITIVVAIVNSVNKNKEMERHEGSMYFSTKPNCIATAITSGICAFSSFTQFFRERANLIVIAIVFAFISAVFAISIVKYKTFK